MGSNFGLGIHSGSSWSCSWTKISIESYPTPKSGVTNRVKRLGAWKMGREYMVDYILSSFRKIFSHCFEWAVSKHRTSALLGWSCVCGCSVGQGGCVHQLFSDLFRQIGLCNGTYNSWDDKYTSNRTRLLLSVRMAMERRRTFFPNSVANKYS